MSLIVSYTRGADALTTPYIETIPSYILTGVAAVGAANQAIYVPVRVPGNKPIAVSTATWYIGAAAGNVDAGVGTISGTTFTLLASTGSVAASGTNARQSAALSSTVVLIPDTTYYIPFVGSTITTLTIGRYATVATLFGVDEYFKGSELPLTSGATVSAGANGVAGVPWVRLS